MKLLNEWVSDELLNALGWTLVHSLWQLAAAAGMLWLVLMLLKNSSPALKYGLAVGTLVFSLLLTVGTFSYHWFKSASKSDFSLAEVRFLMSQPHTLMQESNFEFTINQVINWIESNLPVLVNFWFFGAFLFLFRLLNSLSEIHRLRKSAQLATDLDLQKMTCRLLEKLGISREVELRISKLAHSPVTFGTVKPVIFLPLALIFHLSPAQLEAIIAHELAHVKRNDYLSNLLLSSLDILFFFHPCYWWMSQTINELRENAADDVALKVGIQPKVLAISLAEVLNFVKQNPPELALTASKKRNPTLIRIKRMLGYPTENYPQTPIISIPMLFALFLSVGLMASAQQDVSQSEMTSLKKNLASKPVYESLPLDTLPLTQLQVSKTGTQRMTITTEEGVSYYIMGDKMISGKDTIVLSEKIKVAMDKLTRLDAGNMPELLIPDAPEFDNEWIAPIPDFDLDIPLPPTPIEPPFEPVDFGKLSEWNFNFGDTSKMSKKERKKWRKEIESMTKEAVSQAERMSKEWEKKWEENESVRQEKMAEWEAKFQQEFQPKLKEFEEKMKAWQEVNEPKIKEFESKIKEWQTAQEPMIREWEMKMKEWEKRQQPKREEFNRKMDIWQKEHQVKMEEFQKLLQEEFQKGKDKN